MTDPRTIHEDLRYVRNVVHRGEVGNPAIVYFLWAAITFAGYALIDFYPEKSGLYWMIAGPLGGVLSGVLAWREARSSGQESRADGRLHSLHWTGMMFAILLVIPLQVVGLISMGAVPRIVLIIVAFAYFAMGVFDDRKMMWVGGLAAAGYVVSIVLRDFRWVWTLTAACLACALIAAGIAARSATGRPREKLLLKDEIGSLDRLLEHRVRLGVCVLLTRWDRLSFSRLKELTGETDGSLGANLKKLEDEHYLSVSKEFVDRKPVTWYAITAKGRKALRAHLSALERMIGQAGGGPGRRR